MSGDRSDLTGRTALVTGASRRIALEIAREAERAAEIALKRISKPDVAAAALLAADAAARITGEVLVVDAGKRLGSTRRRWRPGCASWTSTSRRRSS